jgi:hypothetical protein
MSTSGIDKCILPFVSFTSMITSLAMSFETDAWACKSGAKFGSIAAISVLAFLAINAVQHHVKMPMAARHSLNVTSIILPQLMLSIGEAFCKDKQKSSADVSRLVTVWAVPVAIYSMGATPASIQAICKMLNFLGLSDETVLRFAGQGAKKNALPYWARFEPPIAGGGSDADAAPTPNASSKPFTHFRTTYLVPPTVRKTGQRMRQIVRNPVF